MADGDLSREAFVERLHAFEAGYVIGHLGGVGVWFQLLTAMLFEHEHTGARRLLLGEAFFTAGAGGDAGGGVLPGQGLTPRNACIVPWDRVQSVRDQGGELVIELEHGRLRVIPAEAEPDLDWLPEGEEA